RMWDVGIPTGAVIDEIGSTTSPNFDDLRYEVMTSSKGERLKLSYHLPGDRPRHLEIEPRREKDGLYPTIGLAPPEELRLREPKKLPSSLRELIHLPVYHDSAAAFAEPAFQFGDRIAATTDPDHADQIKPLPPNPRDATGKKLDFFEFGRRMKLLT